MKWKKLNAVIITLSLIVLFAYISLVDGFDNIFRVLTTVSPLWLAASLGMMLLYWLLEAVILHLAVKRLHPQQRFSSTFHTSMIGQFFNCVTPSASGGQPMQALHMVKAGVPLGVASSSLLVKFIVYQGTLTLYSLMILLFHYRSFADKINGFGVLILIGFFISAAVMAGLLCICFFRRFTRRIAEGIISLLARLHLVKNKEVRMDYIHRELDQFHESFQVIRKNGSMIVRMTALSIAQLTIFFSIPYGIYRSFGLDGVSPVTVLAAQACVSMMSSFVPLPGAIGGAEFSFHTLFGSFMPEEFLNMSILFWRIVTFYLPILVGMFFVARFHPRRQKKQTETT